MSKIYIASYIVNPFGIPVSTSSHAYLVLDMDEDLSTSYDQLILRGGPEKPESVLTDPGEIRYEAGVSSYFSEDGLDNTSVQPGSSYLKNDRNEDGVADNYITRHYTNYSALDSSLWYSMQQYAVDLININTSYQHKYSSLAQNSNSVINTLLNLVGINMADVLPPGGSPALFPGIHYLLDSEESNFYTAYIKPNMQETTFLKAGGDDTLLLEWDAFSDIYGVAEIVNDNDATGLTNVYFQSLSIFDVLFVTSGSDLSVNYGANTLVTVKDFYKD